MQPYLLENAVDSLEESKFVEDHGGYFRHLKLLIKCKGHCNIPVGFLPRSMSNCFCYLRDYLFYFTFFRFYYSSSVTHFHVVLDLPVFLVPIAD